MIEQVLVSRVLSVMPDQDTFWVKGAAMIRNFVVVCAVLLLSLVAFGQERGEAPKAEIFGGYQYFHANSGVSGLSGFNLNGWNASASGFFSRNLGVTADFSGSYGTPSVLGVGVKTNFYTFLFGPTVRVPNSSRLTPFAHVLFGGGRISGSAFGVSVSSTDFTWAAGGGVDVNLSRNFAIRLGQADFLQSRVAGSSQNNFRYSTGIVLKF
jgi:opacity protein-like surface antigen